MITIKKKIEGEKFEAYATLFHAITDMLAIMEQAGFVLREAQKEAEKIFTESTEN